MREIGKVFEMPTEDAYEMAERVISSLTKAGFKVTEVTHRTLKYRIERDGEKGYGFYNAHERELKTVNMPGLEKFVSELDIKS